MDNRPNAGMPDVGELLNRAKSGDRDALSRLVDAYRNYLRLLARIHVDRQLQRFKNESKAAALLQHPNIVPVYGIGVERGVHYYAMQLIEGTTLAAAIEELRHGDSARRTVDVSSRHDDEADSVQTLPTGRGESCDPDETQPAAILSTQYHRDRHHFYRSVARVGQQAAEALHHAHQSGIVHRDIKPSNLPIDRNGHVWVADFGLAQFHSDQTLTASGDFLGTLRYMSPERLDEGGVVDHRCDVYSLGVTLYELATGRDAFRGDSREQIVRRILNDALPAPRKLDPRVPVDLETIIQKATSKAPESRYATAAELAQDLQRFIESKPVRARRTTRTKLLRLWARRNPLPAALVAIVACLLLVLAVGSMMFALHVSQSVKRERALLAETAMRLYVSEIRRAQSLIERGDILAGEQILLRQVPRTGMPDLRGFEWFYLWEQCHRNAPQRVFRHGIPGYRVAYHPDGRRLITGSWGGRIHVWDRASGKRLFELTDQELRGPIAGMGFVDQGLTLITTTQNGSIGQWDLSSASNTGIIQSSDRLRVQDAVVASTRKIVAISFGSLREEYEPNDVGHVLVRDLETHETIKGFENIPGKPMVAFSPDESHMVISGFDGRLRIVDTDTWTLQRCLVAHEAPIWALSFSDGMLATGGGAWHGQLVAGSVKLWDTRTWHLLETLQAHTNIVQCLEFSGDGAHLVSGSRDGSVALWSIEQSKPSKLLKSFTAHSGEVEDINFSPDGSEFSSISGDNTARVWDVERVRNQVIGSTAFGPMREPKFAVALADGNKLACVSSVFDSLIQVRDVTSGNLVHEIAMDDATFIDLVVLPDDHRMAVAAGHFPLNENLAGDFRLFDVTTGKELRRFKTNRPFTCRGIGVSPDGRFLVAACWQHLVVWDVATGEHLKEVRPSKSWIKGLRVHPRKPLVACGTTEGVTYFYELPSLSLIRSEKTEKGTIESIDFSPDGRYFATGGAEKRVKLWDAETFAPVREFRESGNWVMHARFSPDGKRLLSGCMNGHVYLSDVSTGEHLLELPLDSTWVANGEFSRDGSFVIAAGQRLHVWRCSERWQELRQLPVESLPPVCVE